MVKKIKMTKGQYRKLSKSWLGIIVILGILGFIFIRNINQYQVQSALK